MILFARGKDKPWTEKALDPAGSSASLAQETALSDRPAMPADVQSSDPMK